MARFRPSLRRLVPATAVGLALLSLLPAARAEDRVSLKLETLVPARSLAFASLDDIGTWGAKWKQTALAKLGADPDMAAFLGPVMEDLKALTQGGGRSESPLPPIALEAFRQVQGLSGQAAVALVDVAGEMPTLAVGLDFGEHLRDFVTFLQRMKEGEGKMPLAIEEKDGRPWWTLEAKRGKGGFYGTTVGTSVLVSTDRAWLDSVVATKGAPVADAIGSSEQFRLARTSVGDSALFVYGNVPALFSKFLGEAPPDVHRVVKALGIDSIRHVAYGFGFRGEVFRDTLSIDTGSGEGGMLKLLKGAPITRKGLALAPSTAFAFSETAIPLSRALRELRPMLAEIDDDIPGQIDRAMADAKAATGVDIEKDLLSLLSDDLSYYMAFPETGGLYPEVAISFGVKDAAKFEETATKAVDGLLQTLGRDERVTGTQRTIEWHGKRLHVVELSSLRRDLVPFTPTWAVLGDRWVLTLVPHAMKELILRLEAGGPGLAGQEDMISILRAAPENAAGLGYFDLQGLLTLVYDTGVPVLQTAVKANFLKEVPVRLDWALLPPTRVVRPYLRSMGTHLSFQGDTMVASIDSPIGYMLPVMVVAGAAAAFMVTRTRAAMEVETTMPSFPSEGGTMLADMQVRSIAETVRAYRAARGSLPASLGQLLQETNPATGRPWLDRLRRDPWGGEYDYVVRDAAAGDFVVRSAGPDRVPDTLDDVVSTEK